MFPKSWENPGPGAIVTICFSVSFSIYSVSPSPKKGMVKFPRKGHFKRATTGYVGTFEG